MDFDERKESHEIEQEPENRDDFSSLHIELFPHQYQSVMDLEILENEKKRDLGGGRYIETTMGVFGDIPGYGKTLSMVTVIDRNKMEWSLGEYFYFEQIEAVGPSSTYITRVKIKKERLDCTLIVCSSSIIGQWEKEISRSKRLSFHTVTKRAHLEVDPNDYCIVLCSDKMYNLFVDQFRQFAWKRFIFDEAASTHISSMKSVYAGFYWFITATFPNLSKIGGRNTHFIKTIFSTISPVTFGYMLVKNNDDFVKSSYRINLPKKIIHNCIQSGVLRVVGDIVGGDISAMIAAGDIDGAIQNLGGEDGPRNIIDVVTENKKEELLKANEKVREHFRDRNKDKAHQERYEMWKNRVDDIQKKLLLIKERFSKILEEDCSICSSKLQDPVLVPCCQNIVCAKCIIEWLRINPSCHMCRSKIRADDLMSVTSKKIPRIIFEESDDECEEGENEEGKPIRGKPIRGKPMQRKLLKTKPDTIGDIIKENPRGKFIVFSEHDESFSLIKRVFSEREIPFVEIKGSRETREKKLKSYQEGELNTIFLNAKFNGAGINLQMTTDIIIYHEMNELLEIQLIGRANRIGRVGSLNIHYLR